MGMTTNLQKLAFLTLSLVFLCTPSFAEWSTSGIEQNMFFFGSYIGWPIAGAILYLIGVTIFFSTLKSNKPINSFFSSKPAKILLPAVIGAIIGLILGAIIYFISTFVFPLIPQPYGTMILIPLFLPLFIAYLLLFFILQTPPFLIGSALKMNPATINSIIPIYASILYAIYIIVIVAITVTLTRVVKKFISESQNKSNKK